MFQKATAFSTDVTDYVVADSSAYSISAGIPVIIIPPVEDSSVIYLL